jgi:hypothetical protein
MTSMRDYVVFVPSVWFTRYEVKAKSIRDAIDKVRKGGGKSSDSAEYARQLEPKEWPWSVQYQKGWR